MKTKYSSLILFGALFLMVFQLLLGKINPFFNYFDEGVALLFLIILLIDVAKGEVRIPTKGYIIGMITCLIIYVFMATISSLIYDYQSVIHSTVSFFLSIKWFLICFGTLHVCKKGKWFKIQWSRRPVAFSIIAWSLWGIGSMTGLFGSYSAQIIDICAKGVFLFACLLMTWHGHYTEYILATLCVGLLAMTGKAKGYVAICIGAVCLMRIIKKSRKRFNMMHIMMLGVAATLLAWDKIHFYYVIGKSGNFARYRLFATSFDIARDYFPLGSGWGSYGSYYAYKVYSPVYYLYGIDRHPELGIEKKVFLTDAYWPSVIAESGIIGFLAVAFMCVLLFFSLQRIKDNRIYYASVFGFAYMMMSTMEESGFANPVLSAVGAIIGFALGVMLYGRGCNANENAKMISSVNKGVFIS